MIKVNEFVIAQNQFPDGTLRLSLPNRLLKTSSNVVNISWNYESDAELFTLIAVRGHFSKYPAKLYMPYIPHARMDRVKKESDVFTLKYFCNIINSLNFSEVHVLDAHSNVSLALINNVIAINPQSHIIRAIVDFDQGNTALFFPDEGAMKRYADDNKGYPFAFGMKKRDWATGKILGLDVMQKENIIGKNVLIIDDICSRGGTFYHSAKTLLEAGAKSVSLYITHCENTILDGEVFTSGMIDQIYTTRSLIHCDELKDKIIYV